MLCSGCGVARRPGYRRQCYSSRWRVHWQLGEERVEATGSRRKWISPTRSCVHCTRALTVYAVVALPCLDVSSRGELGAANRATPPQRQQEVKTNIRDVKAGEARVSPGTPGNCSVPIGLASFPLSRVVLTPALSVECRFFPLDMWVLRDGINQQSQWGVRPTREQGATIFRASFSNSWRSFSSSVQDCP